MELYKELAGLRCFTREDMIRLCGSENSADWYIRDYLKKGYIERIRRNLYAVISLETSQPIPTRFQIASRAEEDACLVYHSAFEYYGYANQVFYDIYFASGKKVRSFEYDGVSYHPVLRRMTGMQISAAADVRATSIEQTVVDCIDDLEKAGGLEEMLRCLALIPALNEDRLLEALENYGQGKLYQRAGYLLEAFRPGFNLSEVFFGICEQCSSASKAYFSEREQDFIYHKRWKLYAPKDLQAYINKGVTDYDAI